MLQLRLEMRSDTLIITINETGRKDMNYARLSIKSKNFFELNRFFSGTINIQISVDSDFFFTKFRAKWLAVNEIIRFLKATEGLSGKGTASEDEM
jgi:hypothetical protein